MIMYTCHFSYYIFAIVNFLMHVSYFRSCWSQIITRVSSTVQHLDPATLIFRYGTDILVVIGYLLAFLAIFSLHMCRNCYVRASDLNSDIAIRFSSPNFLKESKEHKSGDKTPF